MSNRPDEDPIGHAAKFLWIFALIPVILGSMAFFLPPDFVDAESGVTWKNYLPSFAGAVVIALIGLGVWKRQILAAWIGIAFFGLGILAVAYAALTGEEKKRGLFLVSLLLIWPIKKLFDAAAAMRREAGPPPG